MPDKDMLKKYLWDNNIDIDMSTNDIIKMLESVYIEDKSDKGYEKRVEKQIKKLLLKGYTHKKIMAELNISSTYLCNLKDKMGITKKREKKEILDQSRDNYIKIYNHYLKSGSLGKTADYFDIDPKVVKNRIGKVRHLDIGGIMNG
jgi:hypothetical protein